MCAELPLISGQREKSKSCVTLEMAGNQRQPPACRTRPNPWVAHAQLPLRRQRWGGGGASDPGILRGHPASQPSRSRTLRYLIGAAGQGQLRQDRPAISNAAVSDRHSPPASERRGSRVLTVRRSPAAALRSREERLIGREGGGTTRGCCRADP